jgi:hypothetical protein
VWRNEVRRARTGSPKGSPHLVKYKTFTCAYAVLHLFINALRAQLLGRGAFPPLNSSPTPQLANFRFFPYPEAKAQKRGKNAIQQF